MEMGQGREIQPGGDTSAVEQDDGNPPEHCLEAPVLIYLIVSPAKCPTAYSLEAPSTEARPSPRHGLAGLLARNAPTALYGCPRPRGGLAAGAFWLEPMHALGPNPGPIAPSWLSRLKCTGSYARCMPIRLRLNLVQTAQARRTGLSLCRPGAHWSDGFWRRVCSPSCVLGMALLRGRRPPWSLVSSSAPSPLILRLLAPPQRQAIVYQAFAKTKRGYGASLGFWKARKAGVRGLGSQTPGRVCCGPAALSIAGLFFPYLRVPKGSWGRRERMGHAVPDADSRLWPQEVASSRVWGFSWGKEGRQGRDPHIGTCMRSEKSVGLFRGLMVVGGLYLWRCRHNWRIRSSKIDYLRELQQHGTTRT